MGKATQKLLLLIHRCKLSRATEHKHNTSVSQGPQGIRQDIGY